MSANKIETVAGKGVVISGDDIDTDRIIPARFLKEITFANLGKFPFYDERYNADNSLKDHPFNDPHCQGAKLLFVNKNFGCGSSREHAPQALRRWGIEAIVGESFAEIFASNCITLGIPAVAVTEDSIKEIQQLTVKNPESSWVLDLDLNTISSSETSFEFMMRTHHRDTLRNGLWDSTALLLQNLDRVEQMYQSLPYTSDYRS